MKIDWKAKLSSRKLWAAIIAFITATLAAFGVPDITIEQVVAVVIACSVMISYIIGEGLVDANRSQTSTDDTDDETK